MPSKKSKSKQVQTLLIIFIPSYIRGTIQALIVYIPLFQYNQYTANLRRISSYTFHFSHLPRGHFNRCKTTASSTSSGIRAELQVNAPTRLIGLVAGQLQSLSAMIGPLKSAHLLGRMGDFVPPNEPGNRACKLLLGWGAGCWLCHDMRLLVLVRGSGPNLQESVRH